MILTCTRENLIGALNKVYKAVPTKSELPILSNVLISAKDNTLTLSATNLATTIVTQIGASIDTEGEITVPAKLLRDFVSNLSAETIEMKLRNDVLQLQSESTKSKFNGVTAEDYPDLPKEPKGMEKLSISPKTLSNGLNLVSFAASNDSSRPVFTGIFVKIEGKEMTMAATDGFRLSEIKTQLEQESEDDFSAIIPAKTLGDVSRVYSETDSPIYFSLDTNENLAVFKQNDTLIATRIIDGIYPDYEKIIPKKNTTSADFNIAELLEAVKLTDIFLKNEDTENNALLMKIDPKGKIELNARAQETGAHKSSVEAKIEGEDVLEIGFNSKFLLDFLASIKEESASVKTSGTSAPCLFEVSGIDNFFHVIMPIQINNS